MKQKYLELLNSLNPFNSKNPKNPKNSTSTNSTSTNALKSIKSFKSIKLFKRQYLFLAILLIILQYQYWFAWAGFFEIKNMREQYSQLKQHNELLDDQNQEQQQIIANLSQSHEILEDAARKKLGWIKDDEILVQWRPQTNQ